MSSQLFEMNSHIKLILSLAALFFLIGTYGCGALKREKLVVAPKEIPASFSTSDKNNKLPVLSSALEDEWWKQFGITTLDNLEKDALSNNPGIESAMHRLTQARLTERQVIAQSDPMVTGGFSSARAQSHVSSSGNNALSIRGNQFSLSAAASYEIDIWGRLDALEKAASLDVKAVENDLFATAMSLSSEIASSYMEVIRENATLRLLSRQLDVNHTYLDLIELRFSLGLSSALDVYQQRQQEAATRSQIPLSESRRDVLLHKIAVLTGKPPLSLKNDFPEIFPDISILPKTGLPVELLNRRPDLKSAELRIKAADERVYAAMANRYPSIKLSASSGFSSADFGVLLEQWVWSILSEVSGSIWDGNIKKTEVDKTKARVRELMADYSKTALTAYKEVEDALSLEKKQRDYIEELSAQIDLAEKSLDEAKSRYESGQTDYLRVLTALSSLQNLEINMISAQGNLVAYRIQLYRALGGGFSGNAILKRADMGE